MQHCSQCCHFPFDRSANLISPPYCARWRFYFFFLSANISLNRSFAFRFIYHIQSSYSFVKRFSFFGCPFVQNWKQRGWCGAQLWKIRRRQTDRGVENNSWSAKINYMVQWVNLISILSSDFSREIFHWSKQANVDDAPRGIQAAAGQYGWPLIGMSTGLWTIFFAVVRRRRGR